MPSPRCIVAAPRGIATLAVVIVLLVAASLIVFFANRSLMFEQRTSANHLRAARALAAAESGLEWAIARLNDPRRIGAQCTAGDFIGTERLSFRQRYAPTPADVGLLPVTNVRPGCRLGASAWECACPQAGQRPALLGNEPSFTVELAAVEGDADALRITSRGCTSAARECIPGGGAEPADATAVVQSIVKLVPPWLAPPVAAVTAAGAVTVGAGVQLVNTDAATQGLLVHAGGSVSGAGLTAAERLLITVPGSPLEAALLPRDGSLAPAPQVPGGEAFFTLRFGQPLAQFRDNPAVRVLAGCAQGDCAAQMSAAGAEGYSAFFVDGDLRLDLLASAQAVSSEAQPVLLVVAGDVLAVGATPWFGLVHALGDTVVEGIDLQGALVSGGSVRLGGSASVAYEPAVLQRLRAQHAMFARVAGSWRDGRCASDNPSLPCNFVP
jgi:PilX N-terminal